MTPHDLHDYDSINEMVLVDLPWGGKARKVLIHPGRPGYMYVLDRTTGQVLSTDPYAWPILGSFAGFGFTRPVSADQLEPRHRP